MGKQLPAFPYMHIIIYYIYKKRFLAALKFGVELKVFLAIFLPVRRIDVFYLTNYSWQADYLFWVIYKCNKFTIIRHQQSIKHHA